MRPEDRPAASGTADAVPPPSPALRAALASIAPVRARRPARALFAVLVAGGVYPAWTVASSPPHAHVGTGPVAWLVGGAALWFASVVVPLALALLPARGQVLPDGGRALAWSLLMAALAFNAGGGAVDLLTGPSAPRLDCLLRGAKLGAPTIVAGAVALRRAALDDGWRLGAAVGVAAGSLTSLTLRLTCATACALPAAVSHGGAVLAGAVLGAVAVRAVCRARNRRGVAA